MILAKLQNIQILFKSADLVPPSLFKWDVAVMLSRWRAIVFILGWHVQLCTALTTAGSSRWLIWNLDSSADHCWHIWILLMLWLRYSKRCSPNVGLLSPPFAEIGVTQVFWQKSKYQKPMCLVQSRFPQQALSWGRDTRSKLCGISLKTQIIDSGSGCEVIFLGYSMKTSQVQNI